MIDASRSRSSLNARSARSRWVTFCITVMLRSGWPLLLRSSTADSKTSMTSPFLRTNWKATSSQSPVAKNACKTVTDCAREASVMNSAIGLPTTSSRV